LERLFAVIFRLAPCKTPVLTQNLAISPHAAQSGHIFCARTENNFGQFPSISAHIFPPCSEIKSISLAVFVPRSRHPDDREPGAFPQGRKPSPRNMIFYKGLNGLQFMRRRRIQPKFSQILSAIESKTPQY
jgi:hypothetical protein